jgi:hypothetical protein
MKRTIRLLVVACAAAGILAQAAEAQQPVPADLIPPAGNEAYLSGHAVGVQIYSCNGSAWALVAPRANLYDHRGKLIATHFAGPTWQTKDGSAVVGKREKNVNVDRTAIDWLLLSAASTTPGRLGATTYIQRIHTSGGVAPAGACDAGTSGATVEVPYTADYVFFKARRGCHGRLD